MRQNNSTLSKRLKLLREEKNITISELANALSTDELTISNYESNLIYIPVDFQVKCSNFFNCSLYYLNGSSNDRNLLNTDLGFCSKEYELPQLNKKDYIKIEKIADSLIKKSTIKGYHEIDGNLTYEEDVLLIRDAILVGLEYATFKNKIKYTPKKYRNKIKESI